ncbi:homoserine O-succinyltransferase [Nocardia sp. NPDC127526]|uniref:homoserine O-acetyltransferase/O-succinyltransferase family protein n=1 Tax=Nocardia sp. NPDC127526 TaxID=3345393 RepID=UPI00363C1BBC
MMVVRVGLVDLISMSPDSMTRRVFLAAVAGSEARTDPPTGLVSGMETTAFAIPEVKALAGPEMRAVADPQARVLANPEAALYAEPEVAVRTDPEASARADASVLAAVEATVFGIDPAGPLDAVDWQALAAMDALIISGSEPLGTTIGTEPSVRIVARILQECSAATSLLFSCQSAHAALHLLYGLERRRLPHRRHGLFAHAVESGRVGARAVTEPPLTLADSVLADSETVHPLNAFDPTDAGARLTAGMSGPILVPHSRWNEMTSADLRSAGVPILLDSPEAQWNLATSPDGLRHVFLQGHPEYFADTMAREYRRDLRRWLADPTRPFPQIPVGYFPAATHARLVRHAELVRTQRDPALLDNFPLPSSYADAAQDWSAHSRQFFANWLQAIHEQRNPDELLAA